MLEFYQAYANYHDLMKLSEELIIFIAKQVNGTCITHFNGNEIDLGKWTKLSMREAIIKWWPEAYGSKPTITDFGSAEAFQSLVLRAIECSKPYRPSRDDIHNPNYQQNENYAFAQAIVYLSVQLASGTPTGKAIADLFEFLAEPHLIQPTIIYDFPLAVSPLSKKKPDEPDWVERFEFYIGGFEVGNAFSELNDPVDQLARFEQQMTEKERGDHEAHQMDEDYVRALGYGLPPTAGEGIGIDRLTMLLTNSKSIRDVILFPLLRPQTKPAESGEGKHGESAE
jgi:lysyl-tRNA synthetase class 2